MIRVTGPDWINTRKLRAALRDAPESGTFQFGVAHCNKLEQLRRMFNAGVRCVPYTSELVVAREWVKEGKTVLGRFLEHSQGTDITINKVRNTTRDYWTEYVPSSEEWRIHIFDGLSIARGKKIFEGDEDSFDPTTVQIRNRGYDYRMTHRVDPPEGMRQLAKQAVAAIGETFGAVDILVGPRQRQFVLEVNTAPAMDNYTRAAYVAAIRRRYT